MTPSLKRIRRANPTIKNPAAIQGLASAVNW
jgi:hypothetical protein